MPSRQIRNESAAFHDPDALNQLMGRIDCRAFEWAMQAHLSVSGDADFLASQYRVLRDHLLIGKETLDFIPLKPEYEGLPASELDRSIWDKYDEFRRQLLHEAVVDELSQDARL